MCYQWLCQIFDDRVRDNREPTSFLSIFLQNGRQRPFVIPIDAKNHRVLVLWDLNGYGEYEFDWCIGVKKWPVQALACDGGGGATKNMSPKFSNFGDIFIYIHSTL